MAIGTYPNTSKKMSDEINNLNFLNNNNNGIINSNQNQNLVNLELIKKEASFQIPNSKFEEFIKNGKKNIGKEFGNSIAQAAYNASVEKTTNLINNLSNLLLEAFNNINTNLYLVNEEIGNIVI